MSSEKKRVLIIRFSSLGDVVLTSSVIEPLWKDNYDVYLLTFKPYGELFKEDKRLKVIEISKRDFYRNFSSLIGFLNEKKFYAVVDLHKNLRSFLISFFVKSEVKTRYNKETLHRYKCVFLKKFYRKKPFNVLEGYFTAIEKLLSSLPLITPRPHIEIDEKKSLDFIEKLKLEKKNYIVLGIGARYKKKRYPYFKELDKLLLSRDFQVVLLGDKTDFQISKDWRGFVNLCGKTSLLESLYILKHANFYIGNDSGTTHMARAVKTPIAMIYGGTHPCLGFAPFPDEGIIISRNLSCSPCSLHGEGNCKRNYECLEIPPREIERRIFFNFPLAHK